MGSGKMIVEFFSADIEFNVWNDNVRSISNILTEENRLQLHMGPN